MLRLIALLMLSSAAPSVLAGIVSRDLFEPGDGLLTYDLANGREWLDLSAATLVSEDECHGLLEELAPNGAYAGFRFATADDVRLLAIAAGAT